jgi:heterodisulfide reductase subunit A
VGVFLCECGEEIAPTVDLAKLRRGLAAEDQDVSIHIARHWCSGAGRCSLGEVVAQEGLSAVVVAGCGERTLGPLMWETAEAAGVDRNRTVLVNLLDHCARVHRGRKAGATAKALRMVRAGVEKARRGRALPPVTSEVMRSAAVVGGGVTGMTAAHSLAARGVPVTLIERKDELGGLLNDINRLYPSYGDAPEYARDLAAKLREDPNVEILTGARVAAVSGHAGHYTLSIESGDGTRDLETGGIVIATGADVLKPLGLFGYGTNKNVVTQLEFESMLREGLDATRIVMIQCVGSRNEVRPYCSRVCCTATVKNTITVCEAVPDAEITVLTRGFAQYVGDLDRARGAGVKFLRYDLERPPVVGPETVDVLDAISGEEASISYDLVVLATPLVPYADTVELAGALGTPCDQYGFVAEPHTKLRPGRFAPRGVYVAGAAHWPATVTECQSQAYSAASRAAELLESGEIVRLPVVATVDELTCRGCGQCEEACVHQAATLREGDDGLKVASVDTVLCVGCGVCTQVCPSSAATLVHLTPAQLLAMVSAAAG